MAKCPELIVVGGGLAGLLLAAYAGERFGDLLNITVIERTLPKAPEASLDTRATALSRGSKNNFCPSFAALILVATALELSIGG